MQATDTPKKHQVIFGLNGTRTSTGIPETIDPLLGRLSLDKGVADLNLIPLEADGKPLNGSDTNQIWFELSAAKQWLEAGGRYLYDSAFATKIGGYPKGATILGNDYKTLYLSTVDNNTTDPNSSSSSGWESPYPTASTSLPGIVELTSVIDSSETKALTPNGVNNFISTLGSAAYRNVGTLSGQIPDMSSFFADDNSLFLPSGKIFKFGRVTFVENDSTITYPTPFPNRTISVSFNVDGISASPINYGLYQRGASASGFNMYATGIGIGANGLTYIAIGD